MKITIDDAQVAQEYLNYMTVRTEVDSHHRSPEELEIESLARAILKRYFNSLLSVSKRDTITGEPTLVTDEARTCQRDGS